MDTRTPSRTSMLFPRASQTGSHRQQGSSISALVSTLVPVLVVAVVVFLLFLVLRKKLQRVYYPRTYLPALDKDEHSPKQSPGMFGWVTEYKEMSDEYVLGHSSLDNYLWLRFFKTLIIMCFVGTLITWPILFPVNATGGGGQSGLDILSFSNVQDPSRYYAQWVVACIFLSFVMLLITRETIFSIHIRHAYLLLPAMKSRISTKTVLFTGVPADELEEAHLREKFQHVKNVWFTYDCKDLQEAIDDRTDNTNKLEKGELTLLTNYVKQQEKNPDTAVTSDKDAAGAGQREFRIDQKSRMTHKLKPLIGKKVDTIDWTRGELKRQSTEIPSQQGQFLNGKEQRQNAVFVEFETVQAAQVAFLQVDSRVRQKYQPAAFGAEPSMVIWKNIIRAPWKNKLFSALGTAFITFLCIFWTIPVAFIGILTNINYIVDKVPFLSFINDIPSVILGVVTGLLPTILLAVLMKLVPIIAFLIAKQFEPTLPAANMKLQSWYFAFQVIQVFLITTFTSGAASVATQIINHPTQATSLLAKNLPKASNFYISYFILEGLGLAALQFLNVMPLIFAFLGKFIDKTPRKKFLRYIALPGLQWGAMYPVTTNLGVIALAYSSIAPLVLGFATIGFLLMYLGFRYNMFFTQGLQFDIKGAGYARALQQLTVGVYLSEFCLIGLFAINTGTSLSSIGPLVLMIIFTVITVVYHIIMRRVLKKVANNLLKDEEEHTPYAHIPVADHGTGSASNEQGYTENGQSDAHSKTMTPSFEAHQPVDAAPPQPTGLMGRMKRMAFPTRYDTAALLSKHIHSAYLETPVRQYTEREVREAYLHPAITDEAPVIWMPRDTYGLSRREVEDCKRTIGENCEASDEYAWIDNKGKVQWDEDQMTNVPLWEDPCKY